MMYCTNVQQVLKAFVLSSGHLSLPLGNLHRILVKEIIQMAFLPCKQCFPSVGWLVLFFVFSCAGKITSCRSNSKFSEAKNSLV